MLKNGFFLFVLVLCFTLSEAQAQNLKGSRPNIIVVMTDDQGMGDLSCMGNEVLRTPNIDRFYETSTRFTEFHVSPTCAPTRSAIMSGRFPFNVGVSHTILQRERMALDVFTLPLTLLTDLSSHLRNTKNVFWKLGTMKILPDVMV